MSKLNLKIGMTALDVVEYLVLINKNIKSVFFKVYTPRKNLKEEKNTSPEINRLIFCSPEDAEKKIWLKRNQITARSLQEIISNLKPNQVLGVTSKVEPFKPREKDIFHIPMMDLDCKTNQHNLKKVDKFFKKISQGKGVILETGRSYHFYGFNLFTKEEWLNFLGYCLLFNFIDHRYIGHRIINNYACLRISTGGLRKTTPKVVSIL